MGAGAASVGGRSSAAKVYEVTTLADSGLGSLRAGLAAQGPRYVVFKTGGLITPKSRMALGNPFCTIAGHTAPGGGITLGGPNQSGEALFVSTHDCVIRYLTLDGSNPNLPPGPDNGSVLLELASGAVSSVIYDHCSIRWWSNKGFISYANGQIIKNITMQNSLMYESNVGHPVGCMTDASSQAESCTDQDFHHNLWCVIGHRLPLFNTKSGRLVNNIIWNWDYFASLFQGATTIDVIGNKYVPGNLNAGDHNGCPHPIEFTAVQSTDDTTQKMNGPSFSYIAGNIGPQLSDPNGNQMLLCAETPGEGLAETGPLPTSWVRPTPLPLQKYPIIAVPVGNLDALLVPSVGNSQMLNADGTLSPRRDSQDARVMAAYQANSNMAYFNNQFKTPTIDPGTPYTSSMHDGISDAWKSKYGLSLTDPNLFNKISPNAAIPYIECFLYGVMP